MPRLGVLVPFVPGLVTSAPFLRAFAATLERSGIDSLWAVEHVLVAGDYEPNYPYSADGLMPSTPGAVPIPDPLELLTFIAAATEQLLVGTCVMVAPLHSPAILAKRAATLDLLSGGRLRLGLGIGWQKEEYAAVGVPFADRGSRLEECVGAMRALWAGGPATFDGDHVSFRDMHLTLQPTLGTVPIILGGNSEAAIRRAGRLADGWFPYTIGPEEFADGADLLRATAREAGRSADEIEITVWPGSFDPTRELDPDWVRRYVDAGATRLVVRPQLTRPDELDGLCAQLQRYRRDVMEQQ